MDTQEFSIEERVGLEMLISKSSADNTDSVYKVMKWVRSAPENMCRRKRRLMAQNIKVRKRRGCTNTEDPRVVQGVGVKLSRT